MTNEVRCSMCQGGESLALCERCTKNLEMLDLAQEIQELPSKEIKVGPFTIRTNPAVPEGTMYCVPSRESLEQALEHDETPDLRRYFGVIKNAGK